MNKRKRTLGRAGLVGIYKEAPEQFKTIQLSEFSFTTGRMVYITHTSKTGKD
jgi:hypothetical protein